MLAICGQVPVAEMGTDFFQEIDNDALFRDVALFSRTTTSPEQAPSLLEQAMQSALNGPGVAVLTRPGDVGGLDLPKGAAHPRPVVAHAPTVPDPAALDRAAALLNDAESVTMLVGIGARGPRGSAGHCVETASADGALPEGEGRHRTRKPLPGWTERTHRQPGRDRSFRGGDILLMVGTDFPYRDWYPGGKTCLRRPMCSGRASI